MRAAVLVKPCAPLQIEELELGAPAPDEVIVRLGASGICHSDLTYATMDGVPTPTVLGHEGAGVVEAVGANVSGLAPGDRVISSFTPGCGSCWFCLRDMGRHCEQSPALWGSPRAHRLDGAPVPAMMGLGTFAEAMRVSARSVVKVESDLPDEVLALVGCGVTTGLGAALNTGQIRPGSTVAVIGCGGVGMSAVQGARLAGAARVIVVDPVAAKREIATSLGATDAVDPTDGDVVEVVRALTSGRGVDVAIDAVGYAETVAQAVAMTRKAGTAIIVGMGGLAQNLGTIPLGGFVFDEKRIIASFYGSSEVRRHFPLVVELIEAGRLDIEQIVSKRVELAEVNEVLGAMDRASAIRTVITFR